MIILLKRYSENSQQTQTHPPFMTNEQLLVLLLHTGKWLYTTFPQHLALSMIFRANSFPVDLSKKNTRDNN